MYYFVEQKPAVDGDGTEPDLPDEAGFLLISSPGNLPWGIYRIRSFDRWHERHPSVSRVPLTLEELLISAEGYPPALALAKHEMDDLFREDFTTREQLAHEMTLSLRSLFEGQSESPYVLAKSLKEESGYRSAGEFVWLVRTLGDEAERVLWVSGDYELYADAACEFELSQKAIDKLRGYQGT